MLEVRVPISVRRAWINRTILLASSIRRYYPDAIVRAYVGEPGGVTAEQLAMLDANFRPHKIGFETVRAAEFDAWRGTANEYVATMVRRYKPPYTGSHILMLDADTICCGRFDELFEVGTLCGVQAHVPPFSREGWSQLFGMFGRRQPGPEYEYSGYGPMFRDEISRFGPAYLNTGSIFVSANICGRIYESYQSILATLRQTMDSYFFDQVALTLACAKEKVPIHILPMRYNFPNQPEFDAAYPHDLADMKILHYLRTSVVNRDSDFMSTEAINRLIARRDLVGSNEILRRTVAQLLPNVALSLSDE